MKYLLIFFFITTSLLAHDVRRIEAFLVIGDSNSALRELEPLIQKDPHDKLLQKLQITCYARSENIPATISTFKKSDCTEDRKLLEEIAWAIIRRACLSSSPYIRQEAIMSSFMANDSKGIPICLNGMRDVSEQARLLSLCLAPRSPDRLLIDEVHQAMRTDSSPRVRLQAILALGILRHEEAREGMRECLESKESTLQEKIACVSALSHMVTSIDEASLMRLVSSDRAILRQLACTLVLEHAALNLTHLIIPLMNDPSFDVRQAAIQACGVTCKRLDRADVEPLLLHSDPKTQILGCWLALVHGHLQEIAESKLKFYLHSQDRQLRLFTSGCIAHAAKAGSKLAQESLERCDDPCVRLNLAIGLIWQRVSLDSACEAILDGLAATSRLSWHEAGIFSFVGHTLATHMGGYARLPESEDLRCRLTLYAMLSSCNARHLTEPLKKYLKERTWGISGQTAFLMLQEGLILIDELKELLHDPNREIALQAAFILAMLSQDEEALQVLQTGYATSSRQMKEYILYAIGTVGSASSLPFLVNVLNEPFESLRVISARAILLSLYH